MSLKDITITGSIGTYPALSYGQKEYVSSTDEQSFPIEQVTGSSGGATPNFYGQYATTDLYVNVTQSWDVYDDTPVGIVFSVHNTQDEFIDGEYSGSALEVTNQSLIDADCEQFLTVNTTELDYKVFFYYTVPSITFSTFTNEIPLSNFLDANTAPNDGEIYLSRYRTTAFSYPGHPPIVGIIYAKVARKDTQGNDNTLSLQELTDLRFKFSDITSIVNYHVLTITEYPTYYLYSILLNNTSSIDNNILDHTFDASSFTTSSLYVDELPGFAAANITTVPYYSVNTDILNYYSASTPFYILGDTPNVQLVYTASTTIEFDGGGGDGIISLYYSRNNVSTILDSQTYSSVPTTPITIAVSGTFLPIENDKLFINLGSSFLNTGFTASNIQWSITQSAPPHSSINLTVLEPYLLSNFTDSDCDVLMNNADSPEYDVNFMSVNYDGNGGTLIPSNQQEILNNTAERAPVKPYNYRLLSQTLPRYIGSRNSTDDFNVASTSNVISEEVITHTNLGPTSLGYPSVSSLGTYFAYFDYIGGTSYELINKKGAHILFLIDKDGNIQTPSLTPPYYPNLLQNFEQNKNVNVVFSTSTGGVTNVQGIHPIIRTGLSPKPIIWSQSGSTANSSSTIVFDNSSGLTVPDYRTTINFGSYSTHGGNWDIITHALPHSESKSSINTTSSLSTTLSSWMGISTSTNTTQGVFTLSFIANLPTPPPLPHTPIPTPVTIRIDVSTDSGATWLPIATSNIVISSTSYQHFSLSSPTQTLTSGSIYRTVAIASDDYNVIGGTFSLSQTVSPSAITVSSPYWTTGSSSPNILTGSAFIPVYSPVNPLTQTSPTSSGYSENLPFTLQPQDQIRFEGNEIAEVYTILEVEGTNVSGSLYLTLDRNIVSGTKLNSFFIRRYIPDPNFIIIDVPAEGGGNGYLFPEYTSLDIQNNFDSIIQNLKAKGVIPST
jgi:hypothetical protein